VEGVPGEVLVAHDLPIREFVDGLFHPVEIALELFFRRLPATVEQGLAVIGVDWGCSRKVSPRALPATVVSFSSKVT